MQFKTKSRNDRFKMNRKYLFMREALSECKCIVAQIYEKNIWKKIVVNG